MLRKYLSRMPRQVSKAHLRRASVILPLCDVDGVPSVLFTRRSAAVRSHPGEVCFPGGMVEQGEDGSIVATCLREMREETGLGCSNVLGILRCNWGEVEDITGVAVTPVVGYVGEVGRGRGSAMDLNGDEVAEAFTVPLQAVLAGENWIRQTGPQPDVFVGGRHVVWGLTAFLLGRFVEDVMARYKVSFGEEGGEGEGR